MPTLHKTTEETKLILKWLTIIIATVFLFVFGTALARQVKEFFFPTPLPPPTVTFGKLSPIEFPKKQTQKLSYSVNTISGNLPLFADRITVYKLVQFQPDILSVRRAQQKAAAVGFTDAGTPKNEGVYFWQNHAAPPQTLTLNIFTYDFALLNTVPDNETLLAAHVPDEKTAAQIAQSFVSNVREMPGDIDPAKTKTVMLALENGQLIKSKKPINNIAVRVDFFQKDINETPFVYPDDSHSTMNFLITGNGKIVFGNFFHRSITEISATYPIKSAAEAFANLQKGDGYVSSYDNTNSPIAINNVYLAYYGSDKVQTYLLPVIVFEGNHDFKGYVSAIRNEWIRQD